MEENIRQDLRKAMLAKDGEKILTLRMLLSEITNATIAKSGRLTDDEIILVVQKEVKKRKEAAERFRSGGREEQAQKEEVEAGVLEEYLPAQLSDEELTDIVNQAITDVGATSLSDMGKVIGQVRARVGATADPARISQLVKQKLNG